MKMIVANWKEHPATHDEAVALTQASDYKNMIICPPHRFLGVVGSVFKNATLGAQDYSVGLSDQRVRYVIIGHSDRRRLGDTDEIIAEKIVRAIADGLTPILCVGETAEEKEIGITEVVVREQLQRGLSKIQKFEIKNSKLKIIIAYEPVWAISTELNTSHESPMHADAMICFIKKNMEKLFDVCYLYGGSITADNAHFFLQQNNIDGLLVGAASLDQQEIKTIWQLTQSIKKNN